MVIAPAFPHPPYSQGQFDGLCGLYATINALACLNDPLRPFQRRWAPTLFRHGLDFMVRHASISMAVCDGIDPEPWLLLVMHLIDHMSVKNGVQITVSQPFAQRPRTPREEWLDCVQRSLSDRRALLFLLTGYHDHYTVAVNLTPHRLILRDSTGLQYLRLSATGMAHSKRRHRIPAEWTLILARGCGDGPEPPG